MHRKVITIIAILLLAGIAGAQNTLPVFTDGPDPARPRLYDLRGQRFTSLLNLKGRKNITVLGGTFTGLGVDMRSTSYVKLDSLVIQDCNDTMIKVSGGNRVTLQSSGDIIQNCTLRRGHGMVSGIDMQAAVGVIARSNTITQMDGRSIQLGGNDNQAINNRIDMCGWRWNDWGNIYLGGKDCSQRGNRVIGNVITRTGYDPATGLLLPGLFVGIYEDNHSAGNTIQANTLDGGNVGILVAGGRDNFHGANVIKRHTIAVQVDDRSAPSEIWPVATWSDTTGRSGANIQAGVDITSQAYAKYPFLALMAGSSVTKTTTSSAGVVTTYVCLAGDETLYPKANVFTGNTYEGNGQILKIRSTSLQAKSNYTRAWNILNWMDTK